MRERSIGLAILRSFLFSLLSVIPLALAARGRGSVYSGTREVRLEHGAVFDGKAFRPASTASPGG